MRVLTDKEIKTVSGGIKAIPVPSDDALGDSLFRPIVILLARYYFGVRL